MRMGTYSIYQNDKLYDIRKASHVREVAAELLDKPSIGNKNTHVGFCQVTFDGYDCDLESFIEIWDPVDGLELVIELYPIQYDLGECESERLDPPEIRLEIFAQN